MVVMVAGVFPLVTMPGPSPGFSSRGGQKPEGGPKTRWAATF